MLNTDCYDRGEYEGLSRTETEFLLLIGRRATRRIKIVGITDSHQLRDRENYKVVKTASLVFITFLPNGTTLEDVTQMLMRFEKFGIISFEKGTGIFSDPYMLLTKYGAALIRRIYPHEFNEEVTYGAFSEPTTAEM